MSDESLLSYHPQEPGSREARRLRLLASLHYVAARLVVIEIPAIFWCVDVFGIMSWPSGGKVSLTEFIEIGKQGHFTHQILNP